MTFVAVSAYDLSLQLQGMSKTTCHVRPDKRSSLPYRITWRPAAAALQRPAISQEWPAVALRRWRPHFRIVSAAPVPKKTGQSGGSHPGARDEALKNGPSADDPDFLIIDFDLVDLGPDVSPPEWRFAGQDIRSHHLR
jgi:hypothetical protein